MKDQGEIVNCVACSRPMMAVDAVCPGCGAVQAPREPDEAHTFVSGASLCTECGRPLVPDAPFCAYCGATRVEQAPTGRRVASVLVALSAIASALALAGVCPPFFGLLGVTLGFRAQAREPRHWAPPFMIGAAIAATAIGMVVWFVRLVNSLGQGLL